MKTALTVIVMFSLMVALPAQTAKPSAQARSSQPASQAPPPPPDPNLNAMLSNLQGVFQTTNGHLGNLRIDKWKADGPEKQQMQQIVQSLQRNITQAVPALISDLKAAPGSVSKSFKLYHNVTVVYEYLDSLSEAAGVYGKKEESDPLSNDAANLDQVRKKLSDYIDQAAVTLEAQVKKPAPTKATATPPTTTQGPKKIVIDDTATTTTKKKKKPSPATPDQSQ